MNIVTILSSLNIVGLIAFIITLGFLIYEVLLLSKTDKNKFTPVVPQFQDRANPLPPSLEIKEGKWEELTKNLTTNNKIILLVLSILLIFFGTITLVGYFGRSQEKPQVVSILPTITVVKKSIPTVGIAVKLTISPTPTEDLPILPTATVFVEPTQSFEEGNISPTTSESIPSETTTVTPTIIDELPITSYFNNSLILFAVAGLFLFLSFLF